MLRECANTRKVTRLQPLALAHARTRTRSLAPEPMAMQTKRTYLVKLNVYDLNQVNDWTHGVGVGFYHGGIEVNGREWTFGSGSGSGTGVMEHTPQEAGLPLRAVIPLGETELSAGDIERSAWDLGRDFQGNRYNLLTCNCNHFCDAYAYALGVDRLPGWVNRAALLGSWVACLLPKSLLTDSTVGGGGGSPSAGAAQKRSAPAVQSFSGQGQRLGAPTTGATASAGPADDSRSAMRERAMQAALARERAMAAQAD